MWNCVEHNACPLCGKFIKEKNGAIGKKKKKKKGSKRRQRETGEIEKMKRQFFCV